MASFLGGLTRGVTAAAIGSQRGRIDRAELERIIAREEAAKRQLEEAGRHTRTMEEYTRRRIELQGKVAEAQAARQTAADERAAQADARSRESHALDVDYKTRRNAGKLPVQPRAPRQQTAREKMSQEAIAFRDGLVQSGKSYDDANAEMKQRYPLLFQFDPLEEFVRRRLPQEEPSPTGAP